MRLFDLGFRRLASTAGASDARAAETATGSR
jgi:hypothetical protein